MSTEFSPDSTNPQHNLGDADRSAQPTFSLFKQKRWWRAALQFNILYVPKCLLPAGLYLAVILICFGSLLFAIGNLQASNLGLVQIISSFLLLLFALVACIPIIIWCFSEWIIRLTAFALAYQTVSVSELFSIHELRSKIQEKQTKALADAKSKKGYIAKCCFRLTLLLTIPLCVMLAGISVITYSTLATQPTTLISPTLPPQTVQRGAVETGLNSAINPSTLQGLIVPAVPGLQPGASPPTPADLSAAYAPTMTNGSLVLPAVPAYINALSILLATISGIYIALASFVGIIISAGLTLTPQQAAIRTFAITNRHIWDLSIICLFLLAVTFVVSSPREILMFMFPGASALNTPYTAFAQEIWHAVLSVVITTLSLTPFCEYLRGQTTHEN